MQMSFHPILLGVALPLLHPGIAAALGEQPRPGYRSVLGEDGARMMDRVIAELTPPCRRLAGPPEITAWAEALRAQASDAIGFDATRGVRSAEVQRSIAGPVFRITWCGSRSSRASTCR